MEGFLAGNGAEDDRAAVTGSEELDAHVDIAHVDKATDVQLIARVGRLIGSARLIAAYAARDMAPMRWRNCFLCDRPAVEDIQGVLRPRDQIMRGLNRRRLCQRVRERRKARKQRA